jgi:hypothetical protein
MRTSNVRGRCCQKNSKDLERMREVRFHKIAKKNEVGLIRLVLTIFSCEARESADLVVSSSK